MKLTVSRDRFQAAFSAAAKLAPKVTTSEILKQVLVRSREGQWECVASDTEITITLPFAEDDSLRGAVLLPPSRTLAMLQECAASDIILEIDLGRCTLRWDNSWFDLITADTADFASKLVVVEEPPFRGIACREFKRALQRTVYACDAESTRYALGGVCLDWTPAELTFAATDSRRLAVTTIHARDILGKDCSKPVIPVKACKLLASTLPDSEDEATLAITSNRFRVAWPGGELAGQLIVGRFPDWGKVIPAKQPTEAGATVVPLMRAIKSLRGAMSEEDSGRCDLTLSPNELVLSTGEGKSASRVRLPVACEHTSPKLTVDSRFLLAFLGVCGEPTITLGVNDSESPLLLTESARHRSVVMPCSREG
jgi:DNA polymerase III subunit beta